MTDKKSNNPLYGLKLDQLMTEISDQYGWELLSEALEINRFQFHTGMKSTVKFLRNNQWAKEKVENFYLYIYKNHPFPDDKQLTIAPRDRFISSAQEMTAPADISEALISQLERAANLRSDKIQPQKSSERSEEPPYDPSNPWNK